MEILEAIRNAAQSITMTYPHGEDGRITSAMKEKPYLEKLKESLCSQFEFEIPKTRCWYDFKVGGIFINLKITEGGCDNAFNKKALIFTWGGEVTKKEPGNMNNMLEILKKTPLITTRNPYTEYHYLVVFKETGKVMLKSLVDIHMYKPNGAGNVMQINWKSELEHANYTADDRGAKMIELLRVVQEACKKQIANMNQFAEFDIGSLI